MSLINYIYPECNIPYFSMDEQRANSCGKRNSILATIIVALVSIGVVLTIHFTFNRKLPDEEEEKKRKTNYIPLLISSAIALIIVILTYFFGKFIFVARWKGQIEADKSLEKSGLSKAERAKVLNDRENTEQMASAFRQGGTRSTTDSILGGFLGGLASNFVSRK